MEKGIYERDINRTSLRIPDPGDARETTNGLVREVVEGGGGEIQIGDGTAGATIGDSDCGALSLI